MKTICGDMEIAVLRDRDSSFEPQAIPKRTRDVSGIEDEVLSMYAKGMSQRDIADTISIFKDVVVQRCIVHMIRSSIKYIP